MFCTCVAFYFSVFVHFNSISTSIGNKQVVREDCFIVIPNAVSTQELLSIMQYVNSSPDTANYQEVVLREVSLADENTHPRLLKLNMHLRRDTS